MNTFHCLGNMIKLTILDMFHLVFLFSFVFQLHYSIKVIYVWLNESAYYWFICCNRTKFFKVPTNNWQSSLYLSYFNGHANNYNLYKRQATLISDCNKSCSISLNSTVQMHKAKNANPFDTWKVTAIGS